LSQKIKLTDNVPFSMVTSLVITCDL